MFLQMAVDHGATYSAAVPAIWHDAMQVLKANPTRYKGSNGLRIEQIMCGGSAPAPDMMRWYKQEYNVSFTQGWGMTEMSPMGSNGQAIWPRWFHNALCDHTRTRTPAQIVRVLASFDFLYCTCQSIFYRR